MYIRLQFVVLTIIYLILDCCICTYHVFFCGFCLFGYIAVTNPDLGASLVEVQWRQLPKANWSCTSNYCPPR